MKKGGNIQVPNASLQCWEPQGFYTFACFQQKKSVDLERNYGWNVWLKNDGAQSLPLISHWVASWSPAWQTPLILNCTYTTKCMRVVSFFSLSFLCLNLDPEKGAMSAYPEFKPTAANRPPFIHFKWRAELIKKIFPDGTNKWTRYQQMLYKITQRGTLKLRVSKAAAILIHVCIRYKIKDQVRFVETLARNASQ